MVYDNQSFMVGIATGRQLKGWANGEGAGGEAEAEIIFVGSFSTAGNIDLGSSLRLEAEAEIISVGSFSTAGDIALGSSLRLEAETEIIFVTTFEEVA